MGKDFSESMGNYISEWVGTIKSESMGTFTRNQHAGKPAAEWRAAIEKYEAEIHIYLKAAEMLPPGSKG